MIIVDTNSSLFPNSVGLCRSTLMTDCDCYVLNNLNKQHKPCSACVAIVHRIILYQCFRSNCP